MKRSPLPDTRYICALAAAAACAALGFASCALTDGDPWGILDDIALEARVEVPVEHGAAVFTTNRNYRVQLEGLSFEEIESATVFVGPMRGAGALSFDPANPPPGYTNCHGDHCHRVDNPAIIVLYEDIEAELRATGGGGTDFSLLVQTPRPQTLSPMESGPPLAFSFCDGPCHLDRGRLSHLEVFVPTVRMRGTIEDLQVRNPRLPTEAAPLRFDLTLSDVTLRGELSGVIERGHSLHLAITAALTTEPGLFNDVPFEAFLPDADPDARAAAEQRIADNLPLHHDIAAAVRRGSRPHGDE